MCILYCLVYNTILRPEGGGVKIKFSGLMLSELAPKDEQVAKNLMFILPCVPEISLIKVEVYTLITGKLEL